MGGTAAASVVPLSDRDMFDLVLPAPTAVQSREPHQFVSFELTPLSVLR